MVIPVFAQQGDKVTEYKEEVLRVLRTIPGIQVHDGEVPDDIPEDGNGFILPYVVLFSGDGDALPETDLSGRLDTLSLRWDFQTTSVGATAAVASAVAAAVRRALTNLPLGTYHVLPLEGFSGAPLKDTDTNPPRLFLPRQWRLDTT